MCEYTFVNGGGHYLNVAAILQQTFSKYLGIFILLFVGLK